MSDASDGAREGRVAGGSARSYSAAYKRRILEELDAATLPGEKGAIMRRERLYSSAVGRWRRQRDAAVSASLSAQKRGPKVDGLALENRRLRSRNEVLEARLETAEALVEAQGKAFALLQRLSRKSDTES